MKTAVKLSSALITLLTVFTSLSSCGIAAMFSLEYTLDDFFDDWKPETDENVILCYSGILCQHDINKDKDVLNLRDHCEGIVEEVYCIKNDKVYACCSISDPNVKGNRLWSIVSVDLHSKETKVHYCGDLLKTDDFSNGYFPLSYYDDDNRETGGMYSDEKIYLKGKDETVCFDINSNTVTEVEGLPTSKYTVKEKTYQSVTVVNTESGESRTITLESMAAKNEYAEKIHELSSQKINTGESPTCRFFSDLKIVEDDIYIIGQIYNRNGNAFAVVFKYDFENDAFCYVSYLKTYDPVGGTEVLVNCD